MLQQTFSRSVKDGADMVDGDVCHVGTMEFGVIPKKEIEENGRASELVRVEQPLPQNFNGLNRPGPNFHLQRVARGHQLA
jgi:hypothetical protein